jgi:hypothetical protein
MLTAVVLYIVGLCCTVTATALFAIATDWLPQALHFTTCAICIKVHHCDTVAAIAAVALVHLLGLLQVAH